MVLNSFGVSHCEELVESRQLETVIRRMSYVEQLASRTLDPTVASKFRWLLPKPFIRLTDLRRMHALEGLSQRIDQLRLKIGMGYQTRFWTFRCATYANMAPACRRRIL